MRRLFDDSLSDAPICAIERPHEVRVVKSNLPRAVCNVTLAIKAWSDIFNGHDEACDLSVLFQWGNRDALAHLLEMRRRCLGRARNQIAMEGRSEYFNDTLLQTPPEVPEQTASFQIGNDGQQGAARSLAGVDLRQSSERG